MRSLFLRILLSFWGATVLIGAFLVALALTADPRQAEFHRHEERLTRLGRELSAAYARGGPAALADLERKNAAQSGFAAHLFRGGGAPLSGLHAPAPALRLAARALATGERELLGGRRGLWLALPLGGGTLVVAEVRPPSRLARLLDPYGLTLRLGVAFAIIGLVSLLLARSLSAPIRRLREATQGLAAGDLSVRVGPALSRGRDETAALARDFDRMAEQIEGLLAAQKRLLRDISHELRSPLARLGVALGLVRQQAPGEAAAHLDRIEREAERLNDLIGELLTLTVLETGAERLRAAEVDLAALVREVAEDADFEARSRGRGVRAAGEEGLAVRGDGELLRRALENVVRNAVRFTVEGSEVEVELGRAGALARIAVRDRGPGVPEETLGSLFEPFYRVADARERQSGGTGIGLAITARAARLHGGSARAANRPGGGLEVTIDLPLARGGGAAPLPPPPA